MGAPRLPPALLACAVVLGLTACRGSPSSEPVQAGPAPSMDGVRTPYPDVMAASRGPAPAAAATPAAAQRKGAAQPPSDPQAAFDALSAAYREAHRGVRAPHPGDAPAGQPVELGSAPGQCAPVPGVGCYLARPGSTALLIYFRGFLTRTLPGGAVSDVSHVPDARLAESAADAIKQYGLAQAAEALGASLLVTGSSHVTVELSRLPQGAARPQKVTVAAHSGGYLGLLQSLPGLPKLEALALLDCFYGAGQGGAAERLGRAVGERVRRDGTKCGGFYFDTKDRYEAFFAPAAGPGACAVAAESSHNTHIGERLLAAVKR